jgi:hypothetical protein
MTLATTVILDLGFEAEKVWDLAVLSPPFATVNLAP